MEKSLNAIVKSFIGSMLPCLFIVAFHDQFSFFTKKICRLFRRPIALNDCCVSLFVPLFTFTPFPVSVVMMLDQR